MYVRFLQDFKDNAKGDECELPNSTTKRLIPAGIVETAEPSKPKRRKAKAAEDGAAEEDGE